MRWLWGSEERRRAIQYWARDAVTGLLLAASYEALRLLPIDICSGFGAMLAKNASRRYANLDARARANLRQLRPEQTDPALIDATMSRLWRSVARTKAELSVLDRLWRAGRIEVKGVEYLDAVRAADRPIVGVVLHIGNWEAMGVACQGIGYPVAALYLPEDKRAEERFKKRMPPAAANETSKLHQVFGKGDRP
jgi:KDO2-lipid IV(A) lauroyltransferase